MLKKIQSYRFTVCITVILANLNLTTSCSSVNDSRGIGKLFNNRSPAWAKRVSTEVLKLGNFNWIIVAEPAFSALNRNRKHEQNGITTITVDASTPEVLKQVFTTLERSGHADAKVYVSKESRFIKETETPGIRIFQLLRENAINGRIVRALDHNALEILIMDAKKKYQILIIKTNSLFPYSSVFLELESGYWDGESETALRKRMKR